MSWEATICFQRIEMMVEAWRRGRKSEKLRKADLIMWMATFSKEGSLRKEWEAETFPKIPGSVARVEADG